MGDEVYAEARRQRQELGDNDEQTDVQFAVQEIAKERENRRKELGYLPQVTIEEFAHLFAVALRE